MKKVFNLLVQIEVEGADRNEIGTKLTTLRETVDNTLIRSGKANVRGVTVVDGYWDSVEDYESGQDCHDDVDWEKANG